MVGGGGGVSAAREEEGAVLWLEVEGGEVKGGPSVFIGGGVKEGGAAGLGEADEEQKRGVHNTRARPEFSRRR